MLGLVIVLCAMTPCVAAAGESDELITGLRSRAQTDELVRRARSGDEETRLRALTEGHGVMRPDFKAAVLENLDHVDPRVREAALAAVLPSRVSAAYPRLAAALAAEFPGQLDPPFPCVPEGLTDFWYTTGPVINQFWELGAAAGPTLVRFLSSDDATARRVAVHLLGAAQWRPAVPHLIPLLRDPDGRVRSRAIKALGVIATPEALDALAALSDHADEEAVSSVAAYLSLNRDARALPLWRRLLTHGTSGRSGAEGAEALRRHPFRDAVSILIEGLTARGIAPGATSGVYAMHQALKELTARDFGYRTGLETSGPTTGEEQAAAIARWNDWWRRQDGREPYEILADALDGGPGCDPFGALQGLCNLGDPRAIPRLLPSFGRDPEPPYGVKPISVEWVLQTLSGRMLPNAPAWREWWESQRGHASPAPFLTAPNPAIVTTVASITTYAREPEICSDGRLLFVAGKDAFEVYDVANANEPEMIGRYTYAPGFGWPTHMVAADGRVFLGDSRGVHIYRYTRQGDIEPLNLVPCGGGSILVEGNRLLHVGADHATLFDLTDDRPRQLDRRSISEIAPYLTDCYSAAQQTTAVWNGERISLQDSATVPWRGTGRGPGPSVLSNGRAFALLDDRLYVLDLPTGRLLGEAPAGQSAGWILVSGDYCFAWLKGRGGVVLYDVMDANAIRVLGVLPVAKTASLDVVRLCSLRDHVVVSDGYRIVLYRLKSSAPRDPR
jgi:hypothetical protein